MTKKKVFVSKLFLVVKYFRSKFIFYVKTATPRLLKKVFPSFAAIPL